MAQHAPDYQSGQAIPGTVYRVNRVIGAGGMGTVYDVEDTTVGKRYVLKTLHGDLADRADLAARLAREARALAKLQHPNIVEVYTSGTTADSLRLPYYVMERLQGQSLRTVIEKKGRLSPAQACDIGIDLLDALDHAHEFGIIHRDVKPDNIFITRGRDGRSLAKLLDFGIIKLATGLGTNTAAPTGGRFIGTFRYAPPEQILGRDVTPQSDLYSAALVLYEMIAGRGPFDDFTGEIEIGKAHIDVRPPTLSRFVPVPPQIEALVMSGLQKEPAQRPRDAFTFASALREMKKQLAAVSASAAPVSQNQIATVEQVVAQPATAARPATPFGAHATNAFAGDGAPVSQETRIDAPAGKHAATAAAGAAATPVMSAPANSGRVTNTVSLGVHPFGAPMGQETYAAAPLSMSNSAPVHVGPIDRAAETREAAPQLAARPNYDTAPIPLAVLSHPLSTPPPPQNVTLGPHTTETGQRKTSNGVVIAVLMIVVVLGGVIGGLALWKRQAAKNATPNVASAKATSTEVAEPAVTTTAIVAEPVTTQTITASTTLPTLSAPTKPVETIPTAIATTPKHPTTNPILVATSQPTATVTAQPIATVVAPTATATATATATHRRPGSGL